MRNILLILCLLCLAATADDYVQAPNGIPFKFGADTVNDILYPRTKLVIGVDGQVSDVSDTTPIPVCDTNRSSIDRAYTFSWASTDNTLAIQAATDTTPIVVTCDADVSDTFGSDTGYVHITGVGGNTATNGYYAYTASGTSMTLTDSHGNGDYTTGGVARRLIAEPMQVDVAVTKVLALMEDAEGEVGDLCTALDPGITVFAADPANMGKKITIFSYNSVEDLGYYTGATLTNTVINDAIHTTLAVPTTSTVPANWLLCIEGNVSSMDRTTGVVAFRKLDDFTFDPYQYDILREAPQYWGLTAPLNLACTTTNLITNGTLQAWSGSPLVPTGITDAIGASGFLRAGTSSDYHLLSRSNAEILDGQFASILLYSYATTPGHTYNFGCSYKGPALVLAAAGTDRLILGGILATDVDSWTGESMQLVATKSMTIFAVLFPLQDTVNEVDDIWLCDTAAVLDEGEGEGADPCEGYLARFATDMDGYKTAPVPTLHPGTGHATIDVIALNNMGIDLTYNVSSVNGIYFGVGVAGENATTLAVMPPPYPSGGYSLDITDDNTDIMAPVSQAPNFYVVITTPSHPLPTGAIRGDFTNICN